MTRPAAAATRHPRGRGRPWRAWALLALLAALPAPAAEAQGGRPRADAAALEAARRFLCPHGGTPVPGRRGRCRGGTAAEASVRGWDSGLPSATRGQAPCPEGTTPVAALARGDAMRCLPR